MSKYTFKCSSVSLSQTFYKVKQANLGVDTTHRHDNSQTDNSSTLYNFQIEFVVAGGGFLSYWNSQIVKIGEVNQCVTENIRFLH